MREIKLSDIPGVRIGHAQDDVHGTGCTVIICDEKAVCGVDIRGGGPASRETQLLDPRMSNDGVNAVLFSGGSAFGLDAAAGVMRYLEARGKGVKVGNAVVPIVVGSCIFDLNCANSAVRPDGDMGYLACMDSEMNAERNGNVGAGTGATVGKLMGNERAMKAGLGTWAVQAGELMVGAIAVVNAIGDVFEMDSQRQLAGLLNPDGSGMVSTEEAMLDMFEYMSSMAANTTIGAIITNAKLDKASMNKVAAMASNGIARTIRPVNTSMDGDSVYALSCGEVNALPDIVGTLGAHVLAKAVNRAVMESEPMYGFKAASDFMK
ncbi:MAG: P1 family peptidase [Clostridia bacterium]|nr:P1 family peptidase [Clostridia bacterium]